MPAKGLRVADFVAKIIIIKRRTERVVMAAGPKSPFDGLYVLWIFNEV